jgi:excisionase family DNA binding protein
MKIPNSLSTTSSKRIGNTISQLAQILEVSKNTIRSWIKQGTLSAIKEKGRYIVINEEANNKFIVNKIKSKMYKPRKAYVSKEIGIYHEWHQTLDEICWLIKTIYTPKESMKRREFRIDNIFAQFLIQNHIRLDKLGKIYLPEVNLNTGLISDDLKRGWYNELAYIVPLKESTLGISFSDIEKNKDISNLRFTFPSWKIICAYYSVYFYLRAITLQKEPNINIKSHNSSINAFKHNLMPALEKVIWRFPLNISWNPNVRVFRKQLPVNTIPHLKYKYACHPRTPYSTPSQLFENIYSTFRKKGKLNGAHFRYTILDFLHDFRVWSNYLDIDNLLNLWGGGYKGFIDQNLSLLLFFIGGISELSYISVHGQSKYVENLQNIYELFALKNPELEKVFINTPPYQRFVIFNKLGFISEKIILRKEYNINEVLTNP